MKTTAWWHMEDIKRESGVRHPLDWHWPRIAAWLLALIAFAALCWVFTWPVLP